MKIIAGALVCIILTSTSFAQEQGVDWKYYGGATANGVDQFCFCDAKGVAQNSADHFLRVWTKCLGTNEIDGIDPKSDLGKKVTEAAGKMVAFGYQPPYLSIQPLTEDQSDEIIWSEATANAGFIQPHARIFYELNCPERKLRELSIYVRDANGKEDYKNSPRDWSYASPETNGAHLIRLLCP